MRGFTVIELLVVLALSAVLAALAVPRLTDRSALQERGARDQLRTMIAHSRRIAMTQQRDVCMLVAPTQARAVYFNAGACQPAMPLSDPAGSGAYQLVMPPGTTLGGAALLRFNSRGQPVPALDQTITVGTLAVVVFRETGFAL